MPQASALRLGGMYVKVGQIMSMMRGVLPKQYVAALQPLQNGVTPKPLDAMAAIIEAELGAPLAECFASFDPTPCGAASVAQVHRATLHDGAELVVKVQYPEVERTFALDFGNLRLFTRLVEPGKEHLVQVQRRVGQ